jgi:hypothetical protein
MRSRKIVDHEPQLTVRGRSTIPSRLALPLRFRTCRPPIREKGAIGRDNVLYPDEE